MNHSLLFYVKKGLVCTQVLTNVRVECQRVQCQWVQNVIQVCSCTLKYTPVSAVKAGQPFPALPPWSISSVFTTILADFFSACKLEEDEWCSDWRAPRLHGGQSGRHLFCNSGPECCVKCPGRYFEGSWLRYTLWKSPKIMSRDSGSFCYMPVFWLASCCKASLTQVWGGM